MMRQTFLGFQTLKVGSFVQVVTIEAESLDEALALRSEFQQVHGFEFAHTSDLGVIPEKSGTFVVDTSTVLGYPCDMFCAVEWILPGHFTIAFTLTSKKVGRVKPLHVEKLEIRRSNKVVVTDFFELKRRLA